MAEQFFGTTNTGRIRDNNEDTFLAEQLPNGWIVACVIDGVGGYEGGEVAAEIARESIRQKLQAQATDPVQTLREGLLLANQNIYQEKHAGKGNQQMACVLTIALVDVESNQFYYAHVGDTRLYLLRDQSLVKVTKDHSFVGFLEDSGRLTEAEAMQHPKRNEINKALGFDPQIDRQSDYIETGSSPFLPGDVLLLCSDGLSDLIGRKEMTDVLLAPTSLRQKGEDLIDAANTAGGKDNITVVLVRNNKKPLMRKATKPVLIKKNERKEAVKPAAAAEEHPPKHTALASRKSNTAAWVLGLLCLLLAGVVTYLLLRRPSTDTPALDEPVVKYRPNAAEQKLADTLLGFTHDTLSLLPSVFGQTLVLGKSLAIWQDTLYIRGNNTVIAADSTFAGPALTVAKNNKLLLLENVVLKDFATAIVLHSSGLRLMNVQFLHCKIPVQQNLLLPADSAQNTFVSDTSFSLRNTLPK